MDIKQLQAIVIDALEDVKAIDIVLLDTTELTGMYDRIVVASGNSNRQTKALAASVRDKVRQKGGTVIGMEGEETGEWVLVDLGDMVVHIMQPPIRAYYRLEEIWGGTPIDIEKAKADAKKKTTAAKKAPAKKADPKEKATPKKASATKATTTKKAVPKSTTTKATTKPMKAPAKTAKITAVAKPKMTKVSAKAPVKKTTAKKSS